MDKLKIYLETTMFSFYHETREHGEYQKYKAQVREVFERIKAGEYEPFASIFVMDEIMATLYIKEEAISPSWETDAIHIAMTTVHGLDFIVSLNFTHIVRTWTIERVRRVNKREGYQGIGIYKPEEVLEL